MGGRSSSRARTLWLASLACLTLGWACGGGPGSIQVREGKFSRVTFLGFEEASPELAARAEEGAPAAYVFYFLVERKPGFPGRPTLRELRDFRIGKESFQQRAQAQLGRRYEPTTVVQDVSDFATEVRPDLARVLPESGEDQFALFTVLPGAPIGSGDTGSVTLRVGWGDQVEPMLFEFEVP